jgi:penicillin-binding protein 1C
MLRDGEIQVDGYRPSNFDDGFYGKVSLQQALQQSLNIPAITTLERLDANLETRQIEQFLQLPAAQLNEPGLALAVGAVYLSPEQLMNLYLGLTEQQAPRLSFLADRALAVGVVRCS